MYMNGTGMFVMAWMGLLTLGLIAAVVGVIVWLARSDVFADRPAGPAMNRTEAETVLRNRYAAGEIDDEEYQRRLAVLHGQAPRAG